MQKISKLGYEVSTCDNESGPLEAMLYDSEVVVCNSLLLHHSLSRFPRLKFIQLTSSGLDRIPLPEVETRNITIANAKGVYSVPIAEWVVLKTLEIYKNTRFFERNQRRSEWTKNRELIELHGKTVGIIGTGSIGTEVAKRMKAFGCALLGLNSTGTSVQCFDECVPSSRLDAFLCRCDVIVIALPLTKETRGLLNGSRLDKTKPGVVVINVSRGGIVNEADLLERLNNGHIRGAALDVFEQEPLSPEHPYWKHPNLLVTPHNSFVSDQNHSRMFDLVIRNLEAFISNGILSNQIELRGGGAVS
ncbi:NAD(P)-dependent oxidoreductase [Cohnella yongneupensis]|uniref:NAD(P)-dependent oxidoreductase n=1 Tax=Cohnella yongneupensis TaxID=425006 RepID=A0ABW0R4X3_9BACL